jgi:hypothetical protein
MNGDEGIAELESLSPSGDAPKRRITTAQQQIAIADKYIWQDQESSRQRARALALANNEPPYIDSELREKGLSHIVNVNFGEAAAMLESALAPYIELINGVPRIPNCVMQDYGDDYDGEAEIISEEFDWFLKEWKDHAAYMQLLSKEFVAWGVGAAIFPDERTPLWEPVGLKDFKLARDTKASDTEIEIAVVTRAMSVSKLYDHIRNPEAAKKTGWNINAVKQAIWKASTHSDNWKNYSLHWEDFQRRIKENDMYFGEAAYKRAQLIYTYNREFDEKWTQLIGSRDATDLLYERPSKFGCVNECFVVFTYGVGQGTYHSVRGLLQKSYNHIQISNRILCQSAQAAISAGLIQLQGDAETIQGFNYLEVGPYTFIPKGLEPVQLQPNNVATQGLPIWQTVSQVLQNNTGSYRSRSTTPEGQSRSATEVVQQARNESTLGAAALNLFYTPYDKLLSEQYRRAINPALSQHDKGGKLALEFRKRCLRRGVSMDRLRNVAKVQAVRALGDGGPVMTADSANQLMQYYSLLDERGKQEAVRAAVASIKGIGYQKVEMFVPKGEPRKTVQFDIANLENGNLRQGVPQIVHDSQNHAVHMEAHMPLLMEFIEAHRQQQIPDEQALSILVPAQQHVTEHLVMFSNNNFRAQEVKQYKQMLQQASAYIDQLEQQVINAAMAQNSQMEEQVAQGQEQGQPDIKQMVELEKAKIKLAEMQERRMMNQEAHQQKLETIRQQMALNDLKTRSSILGAVAKQNTGRPGRPPIIEQDA